MLTGGLLRARLPRHTPRYCSCSPLNCPLPTSCFLPPLRKCPEFIDHTARLQLNIASITAHVAMALPAVVNAPYFV